MLRSHHSRSRLNESPKQKPLKNQRDILVSLKARQSGFQSEFWVSSFLFLALQIINIHNIFQSSHYDDGRPLELPFLHFIVHLHAFVYIA
jgi:hypothetical protein